MMCETGVIVQRDCQECGYARVPVMMGCVLPSMDVMCRCADVLGWGGCRVLVTWSEMVLCVA